MPARSLFVTQTDEPKLIVGDEDEGLSAVTVGFQSYEALAPMIEQFDRQYNMALAARTAAPKNEPVNRMACAPVAAL